MNHQCLLRMLGVFTLLTFVAADVGAQGTRVWVVETVDSAGGTSSSLIQDATGRFHAYYWSCQWNGQFYDCDLKHARHDRTNWQVEAWSTFGDVRDDSLVLDSVGHPHLSYYEFEKGKLVYARYDGSAWGAETLDCPGSVGLYSSLALDAADQPHVGYTCRIRENQSYERYLVHTYYNGKTWITERVDSGVGEDVSLALDTDGHPHMSYYGRSSDLMYAYYDGTLWITETVDSEGDVGAWPAITLDRAGRPHISYYDRISEDSGSLRYAHYDGIAWHTETVDSEGKVGWYSCLVLDSVGQPHISYHDATNGDLKYAYFNGKQWKIETVDEGVCSESNLGVDTAGQPHISYCEHIGELKYNLKHAYRSVVVPLPPAGGSVVAPSVFVVAGVLIGLGLILRCLAHRQTT